MTPKQVIAFFGDQKKAALELKKSVTCIRIWEAKKSIPVWSQHAIAHITNDQLKVGKS